jgi:large subunit ribosomal protein L7/L12
MTEEKKPTEEKKEETPKVEETKVEAPKEEAPKEEAPKVEEKKPTEEKKVETKDVEVPKKFKSLVEEIEKMSVLDLSELVKILEDKFGVSAAAPMMMGAMPGADAGADAAEEKSSFDVEITATGDQKIAVIKAIRTFTTLGLKEAKDLADGAPSIALAGADKEKAEEAKKALEAAGATVTLK